jgi:hypothetical protein
MSSGVNLLITLDYFMEMGFPQETMIFLLQDIQTMRNLLPYLQKPEDILNEPHLKGAKIFTLAFPDTLQDVISPSISQATMAGMLYGYGTSFALSEYGYWILGIVLNTPLSNREGSIPLEQVDIWAWIRSTHQNWKGDLQAGIHPLFAMMRSINHSRLGNNLQKEGITPDKSCSTCKNPCWTAIQSQDFKAKVQHAIAIGLPACQHWKEHSQKELQLLVQNLKPDGEHNMLPSSIHHWLSTCEELWIEYHQEDPSLAKWLYEQMNIPTSLLPPTHYRTWEKIHTSISRHPSFYKDKVKSLP